MRVCRAGALSTQLMAFVLVSSIQLYSISSTPALRASSIVPAARPPTANVAILVFRHFLRYPHHRNARPLCSTNVDAPQESSKAEWKQFAVETA